MGKEISITKLLCMQCKNKNVERVEDFFSSSSDPKYDRILQTIMCEKCGWVGVAIYRLELVYAGEDHDK
jgi:hypothetical protein